MDIVSTFESQATKTIEALKEDLKSIRTGRASPNLVENLIVETYGGQTKLRLLELYNNNDRGSVFHFYQPL